MLKMIRDARIDFRTGIVVILVALAAWAAVIYLNAQDMIPPDFREVPEDPTGETP